MNHNTVQQKRRAQITDDSTIEQITAALGLKASDWTTDLPEIAFDDDDTSKTPASAAREEEEHLQPAEIIDELQRLGKAAPLAGIKTQLCIEELRAALRLASGSEAAGHGGWRVKGMPGRVPSPTENAERIAMLLGHAFSLFTSLPTVFECSKGYDVAAFSRVEAALERLCDSPETLQAAVLSDSARTKNTTNKNLNR